MKSSANRQRAFVRPLEMLESRRVLSGVSVLPHQIALPSINHGHGVATAEDTAQKTTGSAADSSGPSGDGTDTTARVLGVVGIVVGALGVAYGVLAGRRRTEA